MKDLILGLAFILIVCGFFYWLNGWANQVVIDNVPSVATTTVATTTPIIDNDKG